MTELKPISIRNLGVNGLIRRASVDDSLIPNGAVTEAINVHFDRIGAITSRPGLTAIGSTASSGNACIALHNVQSNTAIAAFVNSGSATVYSLTNSTWGSSLIGNGGSVVRFVDFANRTLFFGPAERSVRVWDGSADGSSYWVNTGNPINPQNLWSANSDTGLRPKFGEVFKSRVYLAGDSGNPDRLNYSSVISSSGNITWDTTVDFVDINPSDGENITALKRFSLELLIFKPNYIYRFRTSSVDPDPLIRIGTRSQESVIEGKRGMYFHHDSGFYRYSGGYPVEISRPITDIVKAITFGQYDEIAAWKDDDHIYWSIGDVTLVGPKGNETWLNAVVRYTESSDTWTVYSYSNEIRRGSPFVSSTSGSIMVGLDNGVVAEFNKGTTDIGQPIKIRTGTKWYELDGIENRKEIEMMMAIAEKGQGCELMYQIDDYEAPISLSPSLDELVTYFDKNTKKFHRIRFILHGMLSHESMVFLGLEIAKISSEGIVKQ